MKARLALLLLLSLLWSFQAATCSPPGEEPLFEFAQEEGLPPEKRPAEEPAREKPGEPGNEASSEQPTEPGREGGSDQPGEPTGEGRAEKKIEGGSEANTEQPTEPGEPPLPDPSTELPGEFFPEGPREKVADGGEKGVEAAKEGPREGLGDGGEPLPESSPEWVPEPVPPGSTPPLKGWGTISGQCGVLDSSEWNSSKPFLFQNSIDFGSGSFAPSRLSAGGFKIWKDGNLGGSSLHSEIFAYEVLYRCEFALLLKTEQEIVYKKSKGKKTDLLVKIDGRKVGVSVTRAYHYPPQNPYTVAEAEKLLKKKLGDLPLSAANAKAKDAWGRSLLSVLVYNKQYASALLSAYNKLDASIRGNFILIVTVTDGNDTFLY